MQPQDKRTDFSQSHAATSKSKKSLLLVACALLLVVVGVFAGLKWRGQILEYKENINIRDQHISELEKEIEQLKQNNSDTGNESVAKGGDEIQYLTIKELRVKIPLSADIRDAFYVVKTDGSLVLLSTESVAKLDASCDPRQAGDAQASLGRGLPTVTAFGMPIKEAFPNGKQLNEYYYYFGHPQSRCAKNSELEDKVTNAFKEAILSAEAI